MQPEWEEGFVRDEMDAGTARFLEEYRDYNVSLDIRNYPSGDEAECLRLLNEAVENGASAMWARTAIGPDGWPVRSHPAS